jgi:virginiamycin B lyase
VSNFKLKHLYLSLSVIERAVGNVKLEHLLFHVIVIVLSIGVFNGISYFFNFNLMSFKFVFAIPSDQTTTVMHTWSLPHGSKDILDIVVDFGGNIYFVEANANKIGRIAPITSITTEWTIPTNSSRPNGIAFDPSTGNVYFAEGNTNKIGRVITVSNQITEWDTSNKSSSETLLSSPPTIVNSSSQSVRSVAFDPSTGNVYFAEGNTNKIGRLVPANNTLTDWTIPIYSSNVGIKNIQYDPLSSSIYFTADNTNKIGRLVLANNTLTEWTVASTDNIPDIKLGFDGLYFAEGNTNKIGRFVPATNTITEWTIPTNSSRIDAIAFDPSTGNVYFAEGNTNKIGRLVPAAGRFSEWNIGARPLAIAVSPSGDCIFADDFGRIGRLS